VIRRSTASRDSSDEDKPNYNDNEGVKRIQETWQFLSSASRRYGISRAFGLTPPRSVCAFYREAKNLAILAPFATKILRVGPRADLWGISLFSWTGLNAHL
jgi:hypothetical protein